MRGSLQESVYFQRQAQSCVAVVLFFVGATLTPIVSARASSEAVDSVLPRVVKIFGAGGIRNLHAYCSGFLISPEGHIATVWSHVLDADTVSIVLDDGRRFTASLVNAEPLLDLAILKLDTDETDFPFFDISSAIDVSPGTRILSFSNMFRVATGDEPVSVMHGVVSAHTRLTGRRGTMEVPFDIPVYVLDAVTNNPGAGGGVVTTRDGQLVGMIGKQLRNGQSNTWVNYALPVSELQEIIRQIRT